MTSCQLAICVIEFTTAELSLPGLSRHDAIATAAAGQLSCRQTFIYFYAVAGRMILANLVVARRAG